VPPSLSTVHSQSSWQSGWGWHPVGRRIFDGGAKLTVLTAVESQLVLVDGVFELGRKVGIESDRRNWRAIQNRVEDKRRCIASERQSVVAFASATFTCRCHFDAFGSKWHFPQAYPSRIEDRVADCRGDDRDCSFARTGRGHTPGIQEDNVNNGYLEPEIQAVVCRPILGRNLLVVPGYFLHQCAARPL